MRVTFLGTGTSVGVPMIACQCTVCKSHDPRDQRLRTSIAIELENQRWVIDTGPDFRYQMLRADIRELDAVLFTHEHRDHVAGLDDIRAFNFFSGKDMDIYATEQVQKSIQRTFPYIFGYNQYPGIPKVTLHTIENQPFSIGGVRVTPISVMHHQWPVLGFRIGDFTYITDANYISEAEKEKIKGTQTLVLNALRKEKHISHFTLQEAIDLVDEVQAEKAYFTHISHQLGLHQIVDAELPDHIHLAYDGLVIEV